MDVSQATGCVNELPLVEIEDPTEFDVLCGRGGASLKHPGNLMYRRLVLMNKAHYTTCKKTEKLKISRSIVTAVREHSGRFLERDGSKGTWYDIGDKKAIEKTSQALREGQPKLRQQITDYGNGHPGVGMEIMATPTMTTSAVFNPSIAMQQQMAQQQLLVQQQMLQQKLAQQQFAQQQIMAQRHVVAQRQMVLEQQAQAVASAPSNMHPGQGHGQGVPLHNIMLEQLNITTNNDHGAHMGTARQAQQGSLARNNLPHPAVQGNAVSCTMPSDSLSINPENDSMQPGPIELPQHQPGVIEQLDENKVQLDLYEPHSASGELTSTLSSTNDRSGHNQIPAPHLGTHQVQHEDPLSFGQRQTIRERTMSDSPINFDKQQSFQSKPQPMGSAVPPTDPNTRKVDRRRIFAKMKYSRPASGKMSNRSNASGRSDDGMPDVHMVGSTFSLLSNVSSTQDMKLSNLSIIQDRKTEDFSPVDHKLRDDYATLGSRRSIMSGLSRSSDANSMFSDLSRKIGNISTQSIAMSEISGIEEGNQEDLDDLSFHIDSMAIANAAHMQFGDSS
jgi:hypothetical protein